MKYRNTVLDLYARSKRQVSKKEFKDVSLRLFELISKDMIENGVGVKLPKKLVSLQVRKKKNNTKKKVVDFHKSKLYGVTIYHHNRHSDGYYSFINWDKNMPAASFKNKTIFEFSFTRANKRAMAKQIKENSVINKYFEI